MFVRTIVMSLLVVEGLAAMMCGGQSPLQNSYGQATCSNGVSMPNLPTDAATYMAMAGAGDMFEIQSGQLAQSQGNSADVRNFGTMLINDHTQTTATLKAAAASAGLYAPMPMLNFQQQQMISQLQVQYGPSFDQLFWQQQYMAHEMALALQSNYAANGDTPALRAAAASAVPIVQNHLNKIMTEIPQSSGMCPATYWCNSDVDALGNSFSVCCPSNIFPLFPSAPAISASFSSPYFSASIAPAYSASILPAYSASIAPAYSSVSASSYIAPSYTPSYIAPSYIAPTYPTYPTYTPTYTAAAYPAYTAPAQYYSAPQYFAPVQSYSAPVQSYSAPAQYYSAPYFASAPSYSSASAVYSAPVYNNPVYASTVFSN